MFSMWKLKVKSLLELFLLFMRGEHRLGKYDKTHCRSTGRKGPDTTGRAMVRPFHRSAVGMS